MMPRHDARNLERRSRRRTSPHTAIVWPLRRAEIQRISTTRGTSTPWRESAWPGEGPLRASRAGGTTVSKDLAHVDRRGRGGPGRTDRTVARRAHPSTETPDPWPPACRADVAVERIR